MLTVLGAALEHAPPGPVLSAPARTRCQGAPVTTGRAAQEISPVALQGRGALHRPARRRRSERTPSEEAVHGRAGRTAARRSARMCNLCVGLARPKVRKQAAAAVAEALRAVRGTRPRRGRPSRAFADRRGEATARAPVKAARELHEHARRFRRQGERSSSAQAACRGESVRLLGTP